MEERLALHQQYTDNATLKALVNRTLQDAKSDGFHWTDSVAVMSARYILEREGLREISIAVTDVDSTAQMGGFQQESMTFRQALKQVAVVLQATSRTPEMAMTEEVYENSVRMVRFGRPYPHLGVTEDGNRFRTDALNTPEITPTGVLNPDGGVFESGGRVDVLKVTPYSDLYYTKDEGYRQALGVPPDWGERMRSLLALYEKETGKKVPLAPIDEQGNFENGRVDVAPPDWRIQLETREAPDVIRGVLNEFREWVEAGGKKPLSDKERKLVIEKTVFVDDSNVQKERSAGYLLPRGATKGAGMVRMVTAIQAGLDQSGKTGFKTKVIAFGDSLVDVQMVDALHFMQEGRMVDKAIFILAGGSRLSEVLNPQTDEREYSFVDLGPIKNAYQETGTTGVYVRRGSSGKSLLVIGAEWRPDLLGPQTCRVAVEEFLRSS